MKISFIVLTWNSIDHIQNCINSIFKHINQDELHYEIIIIDNGSTDGTLELLFNYTQRSNSFFHLIRMNHNTGTTYPRNIAIRKAKGEYIVIIDSDIILTSNIFPEIIKLLKNNKKIGLVSPKLIYKDGRHQISTDRFPTFLSKLNRYFFLKKMEKTEQNNQLFSKPYKPHYVDYAISAFWVLPAHVIQEVGLLDENIYYAPEDVDYCLRIWKKGFTVVHCPALTAIHDAREISRGFRLNQAVFSHLKGLYYYFRKHRYIFTRPQFRCSCSRFEGVEL